MDQRITVRISADLDERLRWASRRLGMRQAELCRLLLEGGVSTAEACAQAVLRQPKQPPAARLTRKEPAEPPGKPKLSLIESGGPKPGTSPDNPLPPTDELVNPLFDDD